MQPIMDINPHIQQHLLKKSRKTAEYYIKSILAKDRIVLSQAITLIESERADDQIIGRAVVEGCLPHSGRSMRVGITGTPGVGKSSFIERLGKELVGRGHHLAVLAIDPSSSITKGSILGDKTRMESLVQTENAFIRPSPAGSSLGGVARKTREAIVLCEAAGYDIIFVETVGVGQSETVVQSMTDFFLLLLLPGGGDELQGIKRGIVEMADLVVFNKADGENIHRANLSMSAYKKALHLFPAKENNWIPQVLTCSALEGTGIELIWELIGKYKIMMQSKGFFEKNRQSQLLYWLHQTIHEGLNTLFYKDKYIQEKLASIEEKIKEGKQSPDQAGVDLVSAWLSVRTL